MFKPAIYAQRRQALTSRIGSGLILFLGNNDAPMNYAGNTYAFRQDGSFLYYVGLDEAGLAAVIDVDAGTETLYGTELTTDDVVWTGPQPSLADKAAASALDGAASMDALHAVLQEAVLKGRRIHFLPQYRHDLMLMLERMLGIHSSQINRYVSRELVAAVVAQRSVKADEEIAEIEAALDITHEMHTTAMRIARPGVVEREVAGTLQGIALKRGSGVAFPVIFSRHGETLHNHYYGNTLQKGDIAICDTGASAVSGYAADITRTIPIGGKFSDRQRDIYELVLKAEMEGIAACKPGVKFREVHLLAARILLEGMKALGFIRGRVEDALEVGAQGLFFPHGLGHMMGIDVHDMEGLGENNVGYDDTTDRSEQFGLSALRMAKALQPGYVMTVEPGIYFIPQLIDIWKQENRHGEFIVYERFEEYKGFGGIRIEDDVLVTGDGHRVLGKPIPKTVDEVEALASA